VASSPEIEKLLSRQLQDGEVESTSGFTIDSLKASRKLAQSQLPAPGLWLVKLVQAAVALKATSARVVFGKRQVEFSCQCADWKWPPNEMFSQILSGHLPQEPFLFHLYAGLRGSVFEDTIEAEWTVVTPQARFTVKFTSGGTEVLEEHVSAEACSFRLVTSRPRRWPGLKHASTMPLKHLLRQTASEFMALYNYCWPATISITIDGRLMPTQYRDSPNATETDYKKLSPQIANSSYSTPLPTTLVCRDLSANPGRPLLDIPWRDAWGETRPLQVGTGEAWCQNNLRVEEIWIRWRVPQPGGYLLLLFAHEMLSRVDFVCDGAVVDSVDLPWRTKPSTILGQEIHQNQFKVGLRVVLPVTTDELDLSHFGVRDSARLAEEHMNVLRAAITEAVELCLSQHADFSFRLARRHASKVAEAGSLVSGVLLGIEFLRPISKSSFKSELEDLLVSLASPDGIIGADSEV
jgi:hypothetical protein